MGAEPSCARAGCEKPMCAEGLCETHLLECATEDVGLCVIAGCTNRRREGAFCWSHRETGPKILSSGLDKVVGDQLRRDAALDAGHCTAPDCTNRPAERSTVCTAHTPKPGPATGRVAPSLEQARQNRRGVARDIERRKEDLAAHLAAVFPDVDIAIRVTFKAKDGLTDRARTDAEARLRAAGVISEPCQCLTWEQWAMTIVGSRGAARAYTGLRDLVTAVIGDAQKTTSDAHKVGRDALAVTRAVQQDADNARKAQRSAEGKLHQALALLRRCWCGRPDIDPAYPADRDKYLGR